MSLPLLSGRAFTRFETDHTGAARVAIIDEALAALALRSAACLFPARKAASVDPIVALVEGVTMKTSAAGSTVARVHFHPPRPSRIHDPASRPDALIKEYA